VTVYLATNPFAFCVAIAASSPSQKGMPNMPEFDNLPVFVG
jgi:hypothetical protein